MPTMMAAHSIKRPPPLGILLAADWQMILYQVMD
jgi:hypothetical protein